MHVAILSDYKPLYKMDKQHLKYIGVVLLVFTKIRRTRLLFYDAIAATGYLPS